MLEGWVSSRDQQTMVAAVLFGAALVLCLMAAMWVMRLMYDLALSAMWFAVRFGVCMHVYQVYVPQLTSAILGQLAREDARLELISAGVGGVLVLLLLGQRWLVRRNATIGPPTRCQRLGQMLMTQVLFVLGFIICLSAYERFDGEIRQTWFDWQTVVSRLLGSGIEGNGSNADVQLHPGIHGGQAQDRLPSFIIL